MENVKMLKVWRDAKGEIIKIFNEMPLKPCKCCGNELDPSEVDMCLNCEFQAFAEKDLA